MKNTTIRASADQQKRFASGHVDGQVVPAWDIPALVAAGGLRSSVEDMLVYLRANLGLVETPLDAALAETHKKRGPASGGMTMGLGWHITADDVIWHNGGTGGFHSYVGFHKGTKTGVVVLGNSQTGVVDVLGRALGKMLRGKKYELKLPQVVKLGAEVLDRYVGFYELAHGVYFTIAREGARLTAQLQGQPAFRIYPRTETRFLYRVAKAAISFKEIKDGKAMSMVLHQGGKDQPARRVAQKTARKFPVVVKVDAGTLARHVEVLEALAARAAMRGERAVAVYTLDLDQGST